MPTREQGSPCPSVQSWAQVPHDSPGSQTPLPQQVAPLQHGPQSALHEWQLSPRPQVPSPHEAPVPPVLPPAPPCPPVPVDDEAEEVDEAPPEPLLEALVVVPVIFAPVLPQPQKAATARVAARRPR